MSTPRKTSAAAILKNLPEERQRQIAEWIEKPLELDPETKRVIPKTGGLAYARAQLLADGCDVSVDTLSRFYKWWELQQRYTQMEDLTANCQELVRQFDPTLTEDQVRGFGHRIFQSLALQDNDPKTFLAFSKLQLQAAHDTASLQLKQAEAQRKDRTLKLREAEVALSREKFERETCELFLKWSADKQARAIAESNMSSSEKIAALRQAYFADIDALQESGAVQIPPINP